MLQQEHGHPDQQQHHENDAAQGEMGEAVPELLPVGQDRIAAVLGQQMEPGFPLGVGPLDRLVAGLEMEGGRTPMGGLSSERWFFLCLFLALVGDLNPGERSGAEREPAR